MFLINRLINTCLNLTFIFIFVPYQDILTNKRRCLIVKKLILTVSVFMIAGSLTLASAQEFNVGTSAGIGYPDVPETVSFDMAFFADYSINPYLAVGLETGFGWIKQDYTAGEAVVPGLGGLPVNSTINFFSFPLLAMVTISLPLGEEIPVTPFISGGAGYSWTIFNSPSSYAGNETFHGFTWQAMGGAVITLGEAARGMKVLIEAGYRGTDIKNADSAELEMSSPIVRIGVMFPLSQGNSDY